MNPITQISPGRMPEWCVRSSAIAVLAMCCMVATDVVATDDPYLQLLDEEATKVDGIPTDTETQGDVPTPAGPARESAPPGSRADFENLMRIEHVGTYSFYRRLPERSKEEVYLDYSRGASMESLRGKIVDRYLHP